MAVATKTKPQIAVTPEARAEQVEGVISLMEHGYSENAACHQIGINRGTFRSAALRNEVADNYARALVEMASNQVELVEQAIQDMRSEKIDAQMARVEIDTRKWFASKFLPKRYGDKVDVTSDGKALPSPIIALPSQE